MKLWHGHQKLWPSWPGFGFLDLKPGQKPLQANTYGLAWPGLAGFWPESLACKTLLALMACSHCHSLAIHCSFIIGPFCTPPSFLSSESVTVGHILTHLSFIPLKVEEAFRLFCYVPYTSLSTSTCVKASQGKEDVIFNVSSGFSVKSLDNVKLISVIDWHAAS